MLSEGEHVLDVNGANQWLGVFGAARVTTPLLVLHGGPGANNWVYQECVARETSRVRTLVLHEQRGCGRSLPAPPTSTYTMDTLISDIAAVIDLLQVERVDLLGWSFGADLASRVLLQRPERIRRLVLQAPALDFTDDEVPTYLLASFERLATPGRGS